MVDGDAVTVATVVDGDAVTVARVVLGDAVTVASVVDGTTLTVETVRVASVVDGEAVAVTVETVRVANVVVGDWVTVAKVVEPVDRVTVATVVLTADAGTIASTIMAQSALVLVPKVTVALDSTAVTPPSSAAEFPTVLVCALIKVRVVEGEDMVPAVSVVADLLPSSPIIRSFAFEVDTPVTVGSPVAVPVAVNGRPECESNGLPVFAPEMPKAIAESPFVPSVLPNETVIESEPPALKTAYHSEIR